MGEKITAKEVEAAKWAPKTESGRVRSGAIEIPAGPPPGLFLVVQQSNKKSWAVRYRHRGRLRRLTLGGYPVLSLAEARKRASEALRDAAAGLDPAGEKKKRKRKPDTFGTAFDEWLERYLKPNTRTWGEVERVMRNEAMPRWRNTPLVEVGKADVLTLLDAIVDRGAPVAANRTLSMLKRFFNWAAGRGMVKENPTRRLSKPAKETSRDRVLTPDELSRVWTAAGAMGYPTAPFVRLLILTAQRRGEVAGMCWTDLDLEAAVWTLPAASNKSGRIHDVPLSATALDILNGCPRFAGGDFVFSTTGGQRPVSGFSKMKKHLDAEIARRGETLAGWTYHDLRRSAATELAGMGTPPHVLSAILNHAPARSQGITAIYNRHAYMAERRAALEQWAAAVTGSLQPERRLEAAV